MLRQTSIVKDSKNRPLIVAKSAVIIGVWGASVDERRLHVYDPNYPKESDRYIQPTEFPHPSEQDRV